MRLLVAGVAIAGATAALVVPGILGSGSDVRWSTAIAETRVAEMRFSSAEFDRYRPRHGASVGPARALSLDELAGIERTGDRAALVAALVLAGEPGRARSILLEEPPSPGRDSDLAAVALAAGEPVVALAHADAALAARELSSARWNRALALLALDLPMAAADSFDLVATRGESGWCVEAAARARALREPVVAREREFQEFYAARRAMILGSGPVLDRHAVRRRPGLSRIGFFDALRTVASPREASALESLAAELDGIAGTDHASRSLLRVAASDLAARRRYQVRLRELMAGRLDADGKAALLAALRRAAEAGDPVDDILLGAIAYAGGVAQELPRIRASVAASADPWLSLWLRREEGESLAKAGDWFGAEREWLAGVSGCGPPWTLRCARLEADLAQLYRTLQRPAEAEAHARAALAAYDAEGAIDQMNHALINLANIEWMRGRLSMARAYATEARRRVDDHCLTRRHLDLMTAWIAISQNDRAAARGLLRTAPVCAGVPPRLSDVTVAVTLARLGDPADRAAANAIVAAAQRVPALAGLADVASGRLTIDDAPEQGAAAIRRGLAAMPRTAPNPSIANEIRGWAYGALISAAARRGDWNGALAVFIEDRGVAPTGCTLAVSLDDERVVAAARDASGVVQGVYRVSARIDDVDAAIDSANRLRAALHGCTSVAVIARIALHGRPDLMPVESPWFFVGAPHRVSSSAPRRALLVQDVRPPPSLGLPPLAARVPTGSLTVLAGSAATPGRVLADMREATYVEIHAHGLVDAAESEAAFLALSPDVDGRYALAVADLRAHRFAGAPIVVLAACRTAGVSPNVHQGWSLPDAFLAAGARAVIAAATEIPDDQAAALFTALRQRLDHGEAPEAALAALRAERVAAGQKWAAGLVVFQ